MIKVSEGCWGVVVRIVGGRESCWEEFLKELLGEMSEELLGEFFG